MLFSSLLFLFGFLPIAIAAYYALWVVARAFGWSWRRPSHALLLVLSTYFYWWGERELVLVMLASTAIDFVCGLRIDQARGNGLPRAARPSVQRPETTTFFRPFFASASRTFWSSQEFIEVRSSSG